MEKGTLMEEVEVTGKTVLLQCLQVLLLPLLLLLLR
jgi:hypothetical protein